MSAPHYDAVIVGGGVAGALVARVLSQAGRSVLILEAGIDRRDEPGHLPPVPADALHRGRRARDAERSVSLERGGAVARYPERPRGRTTSTTRRCSS